MLMDTYSNQGEDVMRKFVTRVTCLLMVCLAIPSILLGQWPSTPDSGVVAFDVEDPTYVRLVDTQPAQDGGVYVLARIGSQGL
jgi:hypothetical protein